MKKLKTEAELSHEKVLQIAEHLDPGHVAAFWNFVHERHEIYRRRFLEKLPAPWTEDPVLQKFFFTNVYRQLDKGTIYYVDNVLNHENAAEDFFETLVYRQFNNWRTYEFMKSFRKPGDWQNWQGIATRLIEYGHENNTNIFTDAHMTTGVKWGGYDNKPFNVCWMLHLHWRNLSTVFGWVMGAASLKERHGFIAGLQGFGPFLAYEVVTDMNYAVHLNPNGFTEDDWANPGPGCRKAIDLMILPHTIDITYESVMRTLRVLQYEYFTALEIPFNYLEGQYDLSLRNIEHSLCEYYKYDRAKRTGKARRKYRLGGRG